MANSRLALMRTTAAILGATLLIAAFGACDAREQTPVTGPVAAKKDGSAPADREVTIAVEGMSCSGCEKSITEALEKLDGVSSAGASTPSKLAHATYDSGRVSVEKMVQAINAMGYRSSESATTVTKR
jgi:copper chaperone CopZ